MKRVVTLLVLVTTVLTLGFGGRSADAVPPAVRVLPAVAATGPGGEQLSVIVTLKQDSDLAVTGSTRRTRLRALILSLQNQTRVAQAPLRALLGIRARQGRVTARTYLWITNAIALTADAGVIAEVAARPEVAAVEADVSPIQPASATTNQTNISAPAVWDRGHRGQGVVVASLDSGVDLSNSDLAARWRGGSNSWFDPYGQHPDTPTDFSGHGTGTVGVLVGGDTGGLSVGTAPDARWIAAKVFDDAGRATQTAVHEALQWVLDPDRNPETADAPRIVNGSWSLGSGPGCDLSLQPDMQALRAAGILPVFAAGNFGSTANSSVSPANYPEVISVGAVSSSNLVWSRSSRGPSTCGGRSRTFPDLVAPGVSITTADRYNTYQVATGTSLAAPHAAGALALMLEAYPEQTPDQLQAALLGSARDLGTPGADSAYGNGLVDALAAYEAGAPKPDTSGPVTSNAVAAPAVVAGSGAQAVTLSARADDTARGGSSIVAGEYFVDTVGADGEGQPVPVSTVTPTADLTVVLPAEQVELLADGQHTLWIHSQDAAGNWGPAAQATLLVDRTGPTVGGLAVQGNAPGAVTLTLTGTATDATSAVTEAEWFRGSGTDADPGTGLGVALTVSPTQPWTLSGSLDVRGWATGTQQVSVRARDSAGNWGPTEVTTFDLSPAPPAPTAPLLEFSTLGDVAVPGVGGTPDNADLYSWNGTSFARAFDATVAGIPKSADVDGFDRVDATHFYVSFSGTSTAVPGIGTVQDEDVVRYADGVWSVAFDGTARKLTASNQDIDAFSVRGTDLYFSTLGNTNPPGVTGTADDADIYRWDGSKFTRFWDASANGLPSAANLDGLVVDDVTHFSVSFRAASTTLPGLGVVQDEDVVKLADGVWSVLFDGTARGLTSSGHNLDAFDLS